MSKEYDLILIDGNSLGHAAHNARVLKHRTGEVQAIFFGLKMMKKAVETFSSASTRVICLWDDKAQWRYDIHPEYKGKRDNTPEKAVSRREYKRQVPIFRQALSLIGMEQRFAKGDEADDLASALVHNRTPNQKIMLVSGDHDWLQLVSDDVDWFDPRTEGLFVDMSNFEEVTGYPNVIQFSQSKALIGDGSDNIKGVEGIGDKAVPLIFKEWGSIAKMFAWADALPKQEVLKSDIPAELSFWRKKIETFMFGGGRDIFKRNMRLMNLLSKRHRSTEILANQVVLKSKFDENGFIDLCHEYAFMSIVTNMNQWRKTFAS
ncbi:exodeoxyribonuclease [Pseudomonas phage nickie]|uniref:Exodeoxyribonuclease n=1 Tax=Pseudomonas phage nickie TaxID=2048977 RepID=A0A2H4P757_9CAUD|nr:exodeoxyribonuclease [Pseudomonas phage nickie]ATW58001.1 exodeoxyribonuclease [Pseudomonas phage nickie]